MKSFFRRLTAWLRARRLDDDLAEELESHRAMKQEQLECSGMSREDAIVASRRALGNVTLAREDARAVWIATWLQRLRQDVTYAVRSLRRQPGFATAAIVTLGIGIGLNTSVATMFTSLYWREWPVKNPGDVVLIMKRDSRRVNYEFQYDRYRQLAERARLTAVIATNCGISPRERDCIVSMGDEQVSAQFVSGNYFRALDIGMAPAEVIRSVLSEGVRPLVFGSVLGIAGAIGAGEVLRSSLYGLSPFDPLAYAGVAAIVALAALVAVSGPVKRATEVDPIVAPRHE